MKWAYKEDEREQLKHDLKQLRAFLEGFFGDVFDFKNPKPLKIGILKDLQDAVKEKQLPFSNVFLRKAMKRYTHRMIYHKTVAQGGERYDLQGKSCGIVTAREIEHAKQTVAKMKMDKKKWERERRQKQKEKDHKN